MSSDNDQFAPTPPQLGEWQTATIANGERVTGVIDLERPFRAALIILPDTTNATFNVQVAEAEDGTFCNLYGLYLATPADLAIPKQKASIVEVGARYIKLYGATGNEGADRTVYVRGVN